MKVLKIKPNVFKCEDYIDSMGDFYHELFDEMYWSDSFSSDKCFDLMVESAKSEGITLIDVDDFDADKFFYHWYKISEKGLS